LYSPEHTVTLPVLPAAHIRELVDLWTERFVELQKDENIKYIFIFAVGSRLAATGQACGCKAGYRQDASLESLRYSFNPTLALAARWGQTHPHTTK
ncbi:MAG: hypothetical protein KIG59_07135, partial [Muribaculaceae bacterium]|nr:hypothetical protein [Muribaculaceae bacterium]